MKIKILTILILLIIITTSLEAVNANIQSNSSVDDDILFDLKIRLFMKAVNYPSFSVCIIKNESVVFYKGYGQAKFLTKPTIDTVFPIGSVTKTFTGTALMQLYEKGLFDLDDDINDYLGFEVRNPNYPNVNVTFRMLLAHQSSLKGIRTVSDLNLLINFYRFRDEYPCTLIKRMILPEGDLYSPEVWADYAPGNDSFYSSYNFMLSECLIEILSGQSYISYCQENIFDPLNMTNTGFLFRDFKRSQLATSYHNLGSIIFRIPYVDVPYGVGGIKCSMEDLSHYTIAHMNGGVWNGNRILNESTVELMHSPQYPGISDRKKYYGLGWCVWLESRDGFVHGHSGHVPGGSASMLINGSNDYSILMLTNEFTFYRMPKVLKARMSIINVLFEKAESYL